MDKEKIMYANELTITVNNTEGIFTFKHVVPIISSDRKEPVTETVNQYSIVVPRSLAFEIPNIIKKITEDEAR